MSTTLTWMNAGPQTKTGTAVGNLFADLRDHFLAQAGVASYPWEVASSNVGSTPYYVVLKRKTGAVGRIMYVSWTSAPAGANTAILDVSPSTSNLFLAYFPAGNVDTPSNLTAASGTIMGDDTGALKCVHIGGNTAVYGTNMECASLACEDGVFLFFSNSIGSTSTTHGGFAGELLVDAADNAYSVNWGFGNGSGYTLFTSFGAQSLGTGWTASNLSAGGVFGNCGGRCSGVSANATYYNFFCVTGSWNAQTFGGITDQTVISSTQQAFFYAMPVLGVTAKNGLGFKWRQIALGQVASGAWPVVNQTGPVVQARALQSVAKTEQTLWCTNFKL